MFIKQLSIFLENKQGRLKDVLESLAKNHVNVLALSLADTSDYGVLRLIVSDPVGARCALRENGFSAMVTDVLGVQLSHQAGTLEELLDCLCKVEVNIEYIYGLHNGKGGAAIILKTSDLSRAKELLAGQGVKILTMKEIGEMG